ncbi:MAG: phosphate acyltransferase, partial [Bradymonadia bacterium]
RNQLERILGRERAVMRKVLTKASRGPKRIVFAEGDHPKIIRAAHICIEEGIALPILLGNVTEIQQQAEEIDISLDGITVIDPATTDKEKFQHYVDVFSTRRCRQGVTKTTARRAMQSRNYFAAMMVEMGDADGFLSGMALSYPETIRPALEVIGPRPDINRVAGAYLVILDDGVKVFADTTVNIDPRAEDLVEIAIETARMARRLDIDPEIAMLSYSNFGSNRSASAAKVAKAVGMLKERAPELKVDGEIQVGPALDVEQRNRLFDFCELTGSANVLIFPELNSANIGYKLMRHLGQAEVVGPILIGMNRPVSVLERDCTVRTVVNMAAITVVHAQEMSSEESGNE